MIDKLAKDADSLVYLPEPRYDMQLLEAMKQVIAEDPEHDLLIILHCYGSHFTYHQRYPREFARFLPDDNVAINRKNVEKLVNAYDNSIYYTDHFLSQTIEYLRSLENDCSALLYCADHGEDILDDERERFLHASPTTTFYQLYVANLGWFSPEYRREFPEKSKRPATTNPHRPQPTPCFKAWPISLRSKATSSIRPTRWSVRHSTTGHRAAI